jgi:hypothetical protein
VTLANCKVERLNPDWALLLAGGPMDVVETAEGGVAKVTFTSAGNCLYLKHLDDQPPLKWTRNRRCADAAIIVQESDGLCLHVVELKSKLTTKEWLKAQTQLEGMIANAIALLAVVDGPRPTHVVCHVSYITESIGSTATADPILLKIKIGGSHQIGDTTGWHEGQLKLFGYEDIQLRKIVRDEGTGVGVGDLSPPT